MYSSGMGALSSRDGQTMTFKDIDLKVGTSGFASGILEFQVPKMYKFVKILLNDLDNDTKMRRELRNILDANKSSIPMSETTEITVYSDVGWDSKNPNTLSYKQFLGIGFDYNGVEIRLISNWNFYRFGFKTKKGWKYFRSIGLCLKTLKSEG